MSVTKRVAPVTPRIINTKTSGPTARIRRFKKISIRMVGGAFTSSQKYNNSASFKSGLFASEMDPRTPPTRTVSYTHLRAHETPEHLVCRLLLEKKNSP